MASAETRCVARRPPPPPPPRAITTRARAPRLGRGRGRAAPRRTTTTTTTTTRAVSMSSSSSSSSSPGGSMDQMRVTTVDVACVPGTEAAFAAASIANARSSVEEEDNARFDVLQDVGDDAKFVLVEIYDSPEGGASTALVPIRQRRRGERRSLRTLLPGVSLRPGSLAFNARHRRLSSPLLTPTNSTPTFVALNDGPDPRPSRQSPRTRRRRTTRGGETTSRTRWQSRGARGSTSPCIRGAGSGGAARRRGGRRARGRRRRRRRF